MSSIPPDPTPRARPSESHGHAPAREARAKDEEAGGQESLTHHVKRVIVDKEHAAALAVLNPAIAWLEGLRKSAGGGQEQDGGDEPRRGARGDRRPGGRHEPEAEDGEDVAPAPKPRSRLRSILIYSSIMLLGGLAGGALGYEMLSKLLERQFTESRKMETAIAKHGKAMASAKREVEEAQAKREEAVKALDEAKAKRAEVEKKLDSLQADQAKISYEKQKKLSEIEAKLRDVLEVERTKRVPTPSASRDTPPPSPRPSAKEAAPTLAEARSGAGSGASTSAGNAAATKAPSPKMTGNCALDGKNVAGLKDCIKEYYK